MTRQSIGFILLWVWFMGSQALSQDLTVVVKDERTLEPVFHASVVYTVVLDHDTTRNFGFTDQSGHFVIPEVHSRASVQLDIHHLNYKNTPYLITDPEDYNFILEIHLPARDHNLQEVHVQSPSLYGDGIPDTLTYGVDSIRTLSTPGIEEVLERIEGIQIEGDKIFFKGNVVSKVFLDGVDLASDSYMTVVEAIGSDIIEEIDIISNYQSNPVLKAFNWDETVIQFRSDEEMRYRLSGNVGSGLSHEELLSLHADLVGISPRVKNLFRFTHNSLASTVYRPSSQNKTHEPGRLPLGLLDQTYQPNGLYAPIKSSLYRYNRDITGGVLLTGIPLGTRGNLRNSNYFQRTTLMQSNSMKNTHLLPDTTYHYSHIDQFSFDNYFIRSELELDYHTDQSFINFFLTGNLPFAQSTEHNNFSEQLQDTLANFFEFNDGLHIDEGFQYTRDAGEFILDFNHHLKSSHFTEYWRNSNKRTDKVRIKKANHLEQLKKQNFQITNALSFKKPMKKVNFSIGVSHEFQREDKNLEIHSGFVNELPNLNSRSKYTRHSYSVLTEIQNARKHTPLLYHLSLKMGHTDIRWFTSTENKERNKFLHFELNGNLTKRFSRGKHAIVRYKLERAPINPKTIMPDSTLSPNYLLYLGYEGPGIKFNHQLSIIYIDQRIDKLFDYDLNLTINHHPSAVVMDVFQYLQFSELKYTHRKVWSITGHFNWTQHLIDSHWQIEGTLSSNYHQLNKTLNSINISTHFQSFTTENSVVYRKRSIELKLTHELYYTRIRTNPGFNRIDNFQWSQSVNFKYLAQSEKLHLNLRAKYHRLGGGNHSLPTLDISINYHPSNNLQLRLTGHNLLNQKYFELIRFTPQSTSLQRYGIRHRFVGLFIQYFFS
nr:TonB-dependent receptor [Saprospiraceae bacterium]